MGQWDLVLGRKQAKKDRRRQQTQQAVTLTLTLTLTRIRTLTIALTRTRTRTRTRTLALNLTRPRARPRACELMAPPSAGPSARTLRRAPPSLSTAWQCRTCHRRLSEAPPSRPWRGCGRRRRMQARAQKARRARGGLSTSPHRRSSRCRTRRPPPCPPCPPSQARRPRATGSGSYRRLRATSGVCEHRVPGG